MAWTDERIEQLKQLWGQGMTASQIAEELGGVSRNAVIGKAHRLGLESRPSPVRASEAVTAPVEYVDAAPVPDPVVEEPVAEAEEPEPVEAEPVEAVAPRQPVPTPTPAPVVDAPVLRSIGPGGFARQGPGDQQAPIPPAPPRRLVPAKPSADIAAKTGLLDLNDRICKWPLGHPGEPDFHFCGEKVNPGFPYCLQHCSVAYQAQLPRRDRRPPPPLPFGGPRVR
jgi:GcrA cell cycle regulator